MGGIDTMSEIRGLGGWKKKDVITKTVPSQFVIVLKNLAEYLKETQNVVILHRSHLN
jgi:hypothetical protein